MNIVLLLKQHLSEERYIRLRTLYRKSLWIILVWRKIRWKGRGRIFCISYQKTGTTSVGDFFEYFGYPTTRWHKSYRLGWHKDWYDGNFEAIFSSNEFKYSQVFEDDPWFYPEFYKYLFHRFPKAKFVLITRNSDAWFKSMLKHHDGQNLGNTRIHCKVYRRELDFYHRLDHDTEFQPLAEDPDMLMSLHECDQHYKQIYETRNREVMEFFSEHGPDRLFSCSLEDPEKWQKMGTFFNIKVPKDFEMHSNRTIKKGTKK
ncbi:sulfotransferase [Flagellimonas marinaquae]